MIAYSPASSLGWLDLDAAASERVATLLRSLEEPDTLDELGLATVRDAFSAKLNPGTSTIQTRLRYFIFLPWIFGRLEARRVEAGDFARRLRANEARLIDCLRHLGSGNGVIGFSAGRNLKRMPSAIYWGGLGSWGLRRLDLSIAEYGRRAAALGRQRPERDDDNEATAPATAMWASLPPPPDDFLEADLTFDLTRDEALLLVDHIRRHRPCSLPAFCSARPSPAGQAGFPWEVPTGGMPDRLVELLRHARCFSELTLGPQLVYNVLLARKARAEFGWDTGEVEERQLGRLEDWAQLLEGRLGELRAWAEDLPGFWHAVGVAGISGATTEFLNFVIRAGVDDPGGFAEDRQVHERIARREIQLKSKRARLGNRAALETWSGLPGGGQLSYRWRITRNYLAEIARALGIDEAPVIHEPTAVPTPGVAAGRAAAR